MPRSPMPVTCGCNAQHYARGLCRTHYDCLTRPRKGPRPKNLSGCSEPGCPGEYHALGLCQKHYQRRQGRRSCPLPPATRPYWRNPFVPKIEELAQKMSQSQIAKLLKISRMVVIGIVYRARKMGRLPDPTEIAYVPTREIFPAPGSCLWMDGDPRDPSSHFCGARVFIFGEAWCAEHRKRVYRPMLVVNHQLAEAAD
jgi:hypothetical protein